MTRINKKMIKILILLAYSVPYGYLAMKGDASYGTMIFYGFMIVGFGILYKISIRTNNTLLIIIGNVLSFISSYLFTKMNLSLEEWAWYFKPFTPVSLLLLITGILFVIQILLLFNTNKNNGKTNK